jgi:fatty acid desaturase
MFTSSVFQFGFDVYLSRLRGARVLAKKLVMDFFSPLMGLQNLLVVFFCLFFCVFFLCVCVVVVLWGLWIASVLVWLWLYRFLFHLNFDQIVLAQQFDWSVEMHV